MTMFEPIINLIGKDIQVTYENEVMKAVQEIGVSVNKEELLKALQYDRNQYNKGYEDGLNADKWIPCSERLPEINEEVLVCDEVGDIWVCSLVKDLQKSYWEDKYGEWLGFDEFIAWQPLPEAYKERLV